MATEGYQSSGNSNITVSEGNNPPPPPPPGGSSTIVVRARGTSGAESVRLEVNNTTIATWTLTTSMQNYTASTSSTGGINVRFTNDASGRDVQVDYIQVNGSTRQAESQTTNTGVYQNGRCGGSNSEWMHCNGYIGFGNVSTSGARIATDETQAPETGENDQEVLTFQNPVSKGVLNAQVPEGISEIRIIDFTGRTMKVIQVKDKRTVNEELGVLPGLYILQPTRNGEKRKPQRLVVQ